MKYIVIIVILCLPSMALAGGDGWIGDTIQTGGSDVALSLAGEGAFMPVFSRGGLGPYTAISGDAVDSMYIWSWQGSGSVDLAVYDMTVGDTNRVAIVTITMGSGTHQLWGEAVSQSLTAGNDYAFTLGNETGSAGGRKTTLGLGDNNILQTSATLGAVWVNNVTNYEIAWTGYATVVNTPAGGADISYVRRIKEGERK